ncbi:MAG: helix-turn-helix transcriptional regulator [Blastocatellia bacterium]|nr:helix-turn-helix transcriptional regulator [Blastocatellia bacterium]MBK6428663.1 helix-turn-helix transcriptional regulator [Blastocatellia bacterium]
MSESTEGLAALRPQFRVELSRAVVDGSEAVVAVDATVVAVLVGAFTVGIAGVDREVSAGYMALIDSGTAFSLSGSGERLTLTMSQPWLGEAAARLGREGRGPVIFSHAVAPIDDALAPTIRRLVVELGRSGEGRNEAIELVMALAALDIVGPHATSDRLERLERSRAGLVDRRLRRSIEFMHDNFDRELALAEIAEAAYLSEFHFARLFKRITGVTPHAYLAGLRVEHARRLLSTTDRSIADIGAGVGYQSASHFGKVFRQTTGFTPTEYRDLARRG